MDIETRVTNLEKLVDSLVKQMNRQKMYTDSDINGVRQSVSEITPYTATQSASCGDTEVVFEDVPQGILSVNMVDSEGENIFPFGRREGNDVIVEFNPLEYAADVTISIQ